MPGEPGKDGADGKDGKNGRGIKRLSITAGVLYALYDDGKLEEIGPVKGEDGSVDVELLKTLIAREVNKIKPIKGEKGDKGDKGDDAQPRAIKVIVEDKRDGTSQTVVVPPGKSTVRIPILPKGT